MLDAADLLPAIEACAAGLTLAELLALPPRCAAPHGPALACPTGH